MKYPLSPALIYVAFLITVVQAGPVAAQLSAEPENPQVVIEYRGDQEPEKSKPEYQKYEQLRERLHERRVLEELRLFLAPLKLPEGQKLLVQLDRCDDEKDPYKKPYKRQETQGTVTICYEMVAWIEETADKKLEEITAITPEHLAVTKFLTERGLSDQGRDEAIRTGTFVMVALTEVAPAIFDLLKVPVWGHMENAADRLAAFMMVQFSEPVAISTIYGTALFFELSGKTFTGSGFATMGSPPAQRYYDYLCMAYGGRPLTFEKETMEQLLGDRIVRCPKEYEQVSKAFNLRIMPHIDADKLIEVRAKQSALVGLPE
jgi:hypothetical protein